MPRYGAIALASRICKRCGEMTDDERRRFVEEWFEEVRLGRDGMIAVREGDLLRDYLQRP